MSVVDVSLRFRDIRRAALAARPDSLRELLRIVKRDLRRACRTHWVWHAYLARQSLREVIKESEALIREIEGQYNLSFFDKAPPT